MRTISYLIFPIKRSTWSLLTILSFLFIQRDALKILTFFVFLDSEKRETWEKGECEKVVKEKDCEP